MKLNVTIELEGDDFMEVELFATPEWKNDSYSDEFGLVEIEEYPYLETYPTWNKDEYLFWENWIIAIYVVTEFKKLEQLFCAMLVEETIPDY